MVCFRNFPSLDIRKIILFLRYITLKAFGLKERFSNLPAMDVRKAISIYNHLWLHSTK
jgi:hypothetical protein